MSEPLKLLSAELVETLASDVTANLDRYLNGAFEDMAKASGWAIETSLARWDPSVVNELRPESGPPAEIRNSLLIFQAFENMTPALAREERLWARLCHLDFLPYARARWLQGSSKPIEAAKKHLFANGMTGCRDDNAVGRLWWNGYVASIASPGNTEEGLKRLLSRANIRLQIVDRADTAFRQPLIQGIFRLLSTEKWLDSHDAAVADFMFEVNKRSGGIVFEALDEAAIDDHLAECIRYAKERR
jgi:hypothetical protein